MKRRLRILIVLLTVSFAAAGLMALESEDPPDSEVNKESGYIETADPFLDGTNRNIRYVIDRGRGLTPHITTIADHALDDRHPQLTISADGDAWVVWWRDASTDEVLMRHRDFATGSWSDEARLSESTESSRYPALAYDGVNPWVAFEFDYGQETSIGVSMIIDDPDPVGIRTEVAGTDFAGSVDVMVLAESGKLWVTWVDSSTHVGWVEYDYTLESWSSVSVESYANDTATDARGRIRTAMLEE